MENLPPFTELMLPCCSASGIHGMSEECSREPKSDLISLSCINLKLQRETVLTLRLSEFSISTLVY